MDISEEILAKLIPIAAAQGVDLGVAPDGTTIGDEKPIFPALNLNRAVSDIAHETGMNLRNSGLYVFRDKLVTIGNGGRPEEMDTDRFRTWIDLHQLNYYKRREGSEDGKGAPIKATMKADVAKVLLASDDFRCLIPEIRRILPVRLPVWDDSGDALTIRVLPFGYDVATKVYTARTGVVYPTDWDLEKSKGYISRLLQDFPFGDGGRSLAVQISAMITLYCQLMFEPLDLLPMIFFNANQPGSGKTRLAELCLYPVYGTADTVTYSDNDEFVKRLDTWAQAGYAYTFLDDLSGLIKSNDLNRWITSPTWTGRIMHSQTSFSVENQAITLVTGNQATLSDDLARRSLIVDLWSSELAIDRQNRITQPIDASWLAAPCNRADILAALHGMVASYVEAGPVPYPKLMPSFESWSRTVPAVVTHAGFVCPLQKPDIQDAGGKTEVEFCRLLASAVKDYEVWRVKSVDILLTEWCRIAREIGVFHNFVGDHVMAREALDANPRLYKPVKNEHGVPMELTERIKEEQSYRYMDRSQSTKFATLLNKVFRGQVRTIDGIRYKFADRQARHSTFTVIRVD